MNGFGQNPFGLTPFGDPFFAIFDQTAKVLTMAPGSISGVSSSTKLTATSGTSQAMSSDGVSTQSKISTTKIVVTGEFD